MPINGAPTAEGPANPDHVPSGTMDAERLRVVVRRLESGYYNAAEVCRHVTAEILRDLG